MRWCKDAGPSWQITPPCYHTLAAGVPEANDLVRVMMPIKRSTRQIYASLRGEQKVRCAPALASERLLRRSHRSIGTEPSVRTKPGAAIRRGPDSFGVGFGSVPRCSLDSAPTLRRSRRGVLRRELLRRAIPLRVLSIGARASPPKSQRGDSSSPGRTWATIPARAAISAA